MADQAITALPKKTYSGSSQIASTDYLLGIDSAEGYQMLIQDLGEYIINRATANLAGSTQTLASAISALNSNLTLTGGYNYAESFSSAETLGSKLDALLNAQSSYVIGCYRLSCTASFGVFQNGYDYYVQMARASSLNFVMAEFTPIDNGLIKILGKRRIEGWSFELAPSRTEINTLNSKLTFSRIDSGTINDTSKYPQGVYVQYVAGTVTGAPLDSTGVVITFSWADWYVVQLACVGSAMVWRRYSNSAWSNWTAM